ncbi:hypothetical protein M3B41_10755 [Klebsiella quasipneumoniae]|uniref:hypothetical protein n=1 Tax=Klebsiella pneumoniae TaxID=573 RepID=UPI000C1E18C0|nr:MULTISPECIES: hypothetical protein [Klebsiella]AXS17552.1 hypothetical protein D0887_02970 [Klebsiella pneumoniae]MCF6906185.1 hypothetical protein [Klebsiella pneumoniae]MCL0351223.1 hypothetical protein [Klebsiella pneumoniae]MCT8910135.1 hypothetical protein [Klebsiella pneumoniae]MCW9179226.1 hypothetical protein [Klebsiella pneumoniae]
MLRWQPGVVLLSEFDIKIGRLSASVRKRTLTQSDIQRACDAADNAIAGMLRKDHETRSRHNYQRGNDRTDGDTA